MQPRFKQVPPKASCSATATRNPREAAFEAAAAPAEPAPIINKS